MEEIYLQIIETRISPYLSSPDKTQKENAAKALADINREFVEWKDKNVYFVPRYTDTEFRKSYLYIWWDGLEIRNRHEKYFTLDDLFKYFYTEIYLKKQS